MQKKNLNMILYILIIKTCYIDQQYNNCNMNIFDKTIKSVHDIIIKKHAHIFYNEIHMDYKIIERTLVSNFNTYYKLQCIEDKTIHEIYVDETSIYKTTEAINHLKNRKINQRLKISKWISDMIKSEKNIKVQIEASNFKFEFEEILELFYVDLENTLSVINFLYNNDFIQYNIKLLQTKTCENIYFKLKNICENLLSFETLLVYDKNDYSQEYDKIEKICQSHFNKHFIDQKIIFNENITNGQFENNWNSAICYGLYRHKFEYLTYPLFYYFFNYLQKNNNDYCKDLGVFCIGNLWNKNSYSNYFKHFKLCNMIAFIYADKQQIYKDMFNSKERFKRIMYATCGLKNQLLYKSKNFRILNKKRKNNFGDWLHSILDKLYENINNEKKYSSMQLYIFCISNFRYKSLNIYNKLENNNQLHLLYKLFELIINIKKKLLNVE